MFISVLVVYDHKKPDETKSLFFLSFSDLVFFMLDVKQFSL